MDIELIVDEKIEKEKIVIYTKQHSKKISDIIDRISEKEKNKLTGYINDEICLIDIKEIWSIYTENNKVYAKIEDKIYRIKYRMYEIEEILKDQSFIRISNSEIINIQYIESLSLKYSGTVVFKFKDGSITYSSRRSINKIKRFLNI